jgi:hypothetical protein
MHFGVDGGFHGAGNYTEKVLLGKRRIECFEGL